jgi:endonuclease YncB( thermonuclease family)
MAFADARKYRPLKGLPPIKWGRACLHLAPLRGYQGGIHGGRSMTRAAFLLLALASLALPAAAGGITGPAQVTDGDTLKVYGIAIRLQGVAAPERDDADGPAASAFLRQLVEGREVNCVPDGTKTRNRVVAVCYLAGKDIGQAIIEAGHARDCPRFSGGRYASAEAAARAAGRDLSRTYALPSYCLPR